MTVTIEFSAEEQADLEAHAAAAGLSVEDWLKKLARDQTRSTIDTGEEQPSPDYRPISQVIAEIMSDVPREELAKLPSDGASQIDHYIYGHPKR